MGPATGRGAAIAAARAPPARASNPRVLAFALALALVVQHAAAFLVSPSISLSSTSQPQQQPRRLQLRTFTMPAGSSTPAWERVTLTISTAPGGGGYTIRGTCYSSSRGEGQQQQQQQQQEWTVRKSYEEIERWSYVANMRLGYGLPPLPPRDLCTPLQLEDFLNKAVQLEPLWRSQDDLAFFAVPRSLIEEAEEDATPTYKPDVYDVDGTPLRGEVRDEQDVKKAATIAGGVAGFFLGGPFGAMLGAAAANAASQRSDGVGDVARTAGKATSVVIRQAQKLDSRYDITGRTKVVLKKGFDAVKRTIDTLDEKTS